MSSILDALEKSERERNQDSVPQYHDMQPPEERGFRWKWLWVALIAIVFVFIVFALVRWIPSINLQKTEEVVAEDNQTRNYLQLSDLEKSGIPKDRINVVSVSADRERSFVMLGEKMYREGDIVSEDVTLKAIRKDHVVFNKNDVLIRRGLDQ